MRLREFCKMLEGMDPDLEVVVVQGGEILPATAKTGYLVADGNLVLETLRAGLSSRKRIIYIEPKR